MLSPAVEMIVCVTLFVLAISSYSEVLANDELPDTGELQGQVISSKTNDPVKGAEIIVQGKDVITKTDEKGHFSLQLPAGNHSIILNHPEFVTKMLPSAKVVVKKTQQVTVKLDPIYKMQKLVVTSTKMSGSLSALLEEERAAPNVVNVLSAEQMSRAGDSDIAQALRRVSGLTLVEDKFIYVRGMGERYSSVLLNGARLPSTDPNRQVIELDLLPTGFMEGAVVHKSYSPDLPASFGGGTISLRTKAFPDEFRANISTSVGYSPDTTFKNGYTYDGGDYDFTGYDDGTRDLPGDVPQDKLSFSMSVEELQKIGRSFDDTYDVDEESIGPDYSFGFDMGDSFKPEGNDVALGYTAGMKYSQSWETRDDETFRKLNIGSQGPTIGDDCEYNWSKRDIITEGFLNLGAQLNKGHRVESTTLYIHKTSDTARKDSCFNDDEDSTILQETLSWIERDLFFEQLAGEHSFESPYPFDLNWQVSYGEAEWYVPDERMSNYFVKEDRLEWALFGGYGQDARNYKELDDDIYDLSMDVRFPIQQDLFKDFYLKAGTKVVDRQRESEIRRFRFASTNVNNVYDIITTEESKEDILTYENINPDQFEIREITQPNDAYDADQEVKALFGMADIRLNEYLGFTGGVRFEDGTIQVDTFELSGKAISTDLETEDFLPAVAGTWFINGGDSTKLRVGYSQTLNRPDFKELSRAPYFDPVTKRIIRGNPSLVQTDITNYDLRFEHFFSQNENISLSFFYKDFDKPIEKVQIESVQEERSFINGDSAELYGLEVEILKDLRFIHDALYNFYVSANYAYIESDSEFEQDESSDIEIDLTNETHPLQGQPEYTFNVTLGYENQDTDTVATLLINGQGKQIDALGTEGLDDQYKEPFYTIDFTLSQKFKENWTVSFEAENITDTEFEFEQDGIITRSYTEGRTFTLGMKYTF